MMNIRAMALTSWAYIFRENDLLTMAGKDPNGDPVAIGQPGGVNALPDPDDANWSYLDIIEEWEDKLTDEKKVAIWRGAPGNLVKDDEITTQQGMDFTFTTAKFTPQAQEHFYRTSAKLDAASFQYVPLSAPPKKVWLMLQRYNQLNELIWSANLWCVCRCTGGMKGGKGELVMPTFECTLLYSALNTVAQGIED